MNPTHSFVRPGRLLAALGGLMIAASLLCATGCEKEDTIRVYNAPKDSPAAPVAAAAKPIDFTVPTAWSETDPGMMEFAHYRISTDDPKAAVTVTQAGGGLLPNVNRWQRQLKLPESPESDLPNLVKSLDLPAGKAQVVDLTGPAPTDGAAAPQRTVAVILPHGEITWYFKLAGPSPLVDAQRPNFDAFLQTVKFPDGAAADDSAAGAPTPPPDGPTAPAGPASPAENLTKWDAPAGWKQDTISPGSPRLLSFKVAADDKPGQKADVAVTKMGSDNLDVLLQDINMWRSQVGLGAQEKLNADAAKPVTLGGKLNALLFDFAGPVADKPEKRVVVAMIVRGRDLWFFKLSGSADLVAAQKDAFLAFVQSAQFAPQ